MIVWLDAQLPPALAAWLSERFGVSAVAVRDLGLRDAPDRAIFDRAREARAVVVSKDIDFVRLLEVLGPPPQVVWLTLGNTSNARLREVLEAHWASVATSLEAGEALVEIAGGS